MLYLVLERAMAMSIGGELKECAHHFAQEAQSRLAQIEREIAEIDERKAQLTAQRDLIRSASERAFDFEPMLGSDFQCPRCWIESETRSFLRPVRSEKPREDIFRCNRCEFEYSFPA